jgi:hypothetical protein
MKACGYGSRIALACAHLSETTWIEFSRASMPVCIGRKHTVVTTGGAGSSGLPCAMALTAYFVLPGDRLFCHRRWRDKSTTLAPASGRQDHTTSPSASSAARLASPKRPPHPTRVRDDAYPPGRGGTMRRMLLIWGKAKYFCGKGWTGPKNRKAARRANQLTFPAAIQVRNELKIVACANGRASILFSAQLRPWPCI